MLEPGTKAPDFTLPDQNGELHSLSDYRGKKVILYFYPKDNTPGCTGRPAAFQSSARSLRKGGAVILGVSRDSVASHKRFEEKQGLGFTLLSDPELGVIQGLRRLEGKEKLRQGIHGVIRTTYLIDEDGHHRKGL